MREYSVPPQSPPVLCLDCCHSQIPPFALAAPVGCLPSACVTTTLTAVLFSSSSHHIDLLTDLWTHCATFLPRCLCMYCSSCLQWFHTPPPPDVGVFSVQTASESLFLALCSMKWSHPVSSLPLAPYPALIFFTGVLTVLTSLSCWLLLLYLSLPPLLSSSSSFPTKHY